MENLLDGYHRFRHAYYERHRGLFKRLAQAQQPDTMVISCCDSRVDPSIVLSAGPGDIFTLRNVANLVPPYAPDSAHHSTSAAIEFAVRSLKVAHIIVLGHSGCGGVKALLGSQQGEFIGPWMQIAATARQRVLDLGEDDPDKMQLLCEFESIKISLANLKGYPWLAERLAQGNLTLHGWYFDIEPGKLFSLDEQSGDFLPL